MDFFTKQIKDERLLIVAPIYDKIDKLYAISDLYQPNDILIFLGDICHPFTDAHEVVKRMTMLNTFWENKTAYYVIGDHDLTFKSQISSSNADAYDWINKQKLGIKLTYANNTSVIVIHGGILEKHKKVSDLNDLELCYVSSNGENWHTSYEGQHGYAISAHPVSDQVKTYKYSASIDTECHKSNVLVVQEMTNIGLGKTFYI